VSCTVRVSAGEPVVVRDAVVSAIKRRAELFSPARTLWEPADYASRETFCNIPGRRALAAFVSTGKPGREPVLTVTVFEAKARDERCDKDLGLQHTAANDPPAPAAAPAAPPPKEVAAQPPKKKQGLLSKIPGLGRKD
jgi:hypothetical protein